MFKNLIQIKSNSNRMPIIHYITVGISIVLYLLGRICDDMSWHKFSNMSQNAFQGIALGALATCAIVMTVRRSAQEGGFKLLFYHSQMKFVIPWSLVILQCIFVFQIFQCYHADAVPQEINENAMDYKGCCLYCVVLLVTNLNYSLMCNIRGDLPLLVVFEVVLFGEIIYNGTLLIQFINHLTEKPKDYSILFISILIAWQILVMDLIFRGAYEEREKDERHNELHKMVLEHHKKCQKNRQNVEEASNTNDRLHPLELELENIPQTQTQNISIAPAIASKQ